MEVVNITNIADGAIVERFQKALEEVLKNIHDPNSSPGKVREINMKVKVKPSRDRNSCTFSVSVETKLSGAEDVSGILLLDYEGKKIIARNPEAPTPLRDLMIADG